ncbi:lactose permease [Clostridium pasteurianum DSM 525 = ATCC 6013]|uniref:Lactose permease n=1 Tax=Clostridium pasteurianum DSM 525 = ATCC 6013 TaxID=1262449 RepID=A0A0H3J5F9_CLOPA|nr:MFS transporter [Clostridium pasteurianum]AJA49231.1 lactose permease [Clostridium pasteurianum DSM 525 = ATCC 6013]AJA53219.1 lactose permease [Clostridium pasteurianum DSM 525 = ATCC 6013]AOZ76412.1 galactoside permease [Clostridium pasteurianum DSM 525 = ATCC 6013]AOZ80209.1 galactoside permease [Clostridium pasteurianum]ELP59164.1 galactoside permease [Clostridium pasteurianum DSM 525 = ATCC 6013]
MKKRIMYWNLSAYFLLFFFAYASCFSFFAIWLGEKINLTGAQTGIVFSVNAVFAMIFQPIYGYISDRIGLKKYVLYFITALLALAGPFYIYVYGPLLKSNFIVGALIGGLYLGLTFIAGCASVESYIEKAGRKYDFEFGRARMWGSIGSASAAFVSGRVFNISPNINFWMATVSAAVLIILVLFMRVDVSTVEAKQAESVGFKNVKELFKLKDFWFFMIYMVGAVCVYMVYDQQFPVYYASLFPSKELGNQVFGDLNSLQVFMEAGMMFLAPVIVNKIGPKRGLILAGIIMTGRMVGSGIVSDPYSISVIKLIHSFEYATLLVSIFKYLADNFDTRLSSVLYLVGFQFATQIGTTVLSPIVGKMYDRVGFRETYLFMGILVLVFTIFAAFTLINEKKDEALAKKENSKILPEQQLG